MCFTSVNNIGTTEQVTDYTGAVVQDELHYPWGQDWLGQAFVEERFAGMQHRDLETGFDPTHYRMYASAQGRWLSPDPIMGCPLHPENFDRYACAGSNPENLTVRGKHFVNNPGWTSGNYTAGEDRALRTPFPHRRVISHPHNCRRLFEQKDGIRVAIRLTGGVSHDGA